MISVYLDDTGIPYEQVYEHYGTASRWARDHCVGYQGYETADVSDFSMTNDVIAQYLFNNEQDATIFSLKWK